MRVTHVITRLIVGGAQENTVSSVLGLLDYPDYEVELISGPTPLDQPEGSIQHLVEKRPGFLKIVPELVRPISPLKDLTALAKLRRHFEETRPDIVHTHSGKAGLLGRLAARIVGVPHIIHTIHGPSFGPFQGAIANLSFRMAEKTAGAFTDRFIGVAEAMCLQYQSAGIGSPECYEKVFSGFEMSAFLEAKNDPTVRARWGLSPDDFVIGKIGRLFELKGHDDLFAAAPAVLRENPRAKLLLVGGGEWRNRFERLARELGIEDRVVFTGLVRPEEVASLIGIMDVVVHLSRREGLPRVLPQALAAGKPIVAMDSDGAREVCLDGETGFLIKIGAVNDLVERLNRLAADASLRSAMGRRGRQFVEDEFTVETMVKRIDAIYRRISDSQPSVQAIR